MQNITDTQPFNGPLSGMTRVGWYQKRHSPTHTHDNHHSISTKHCHCNAADITITNSSYYVDQHQKLTTAIQRDGKWHTRGDNVGGKHR